MPKSKTQYQCHSCGYTTGQWMGQCPGCQTWGSLEETRIARAGAKSTLIKKKSRAIPITEIEAKHISRTKLGIKEFDRVLGGGVVPGSLVLLGGAPGIGKSTLLLTAAEKWASQNGPVLYVSAEESLSQTRLRAERLQTLHQDIHLMAETDFDVIVEEIGRLRPSLLILDSVQTLYSPELQSTPGSVSQVRDICMRSMRIAKEMGIPTFLVGHITKDGSLAGPKVLEHMVDTVISFEKMASGLHRILRAQKNRFGATQEIGVLEMRDTGLVDVMNPSAYFLSNRHETKSGASRAAILEGHSPLLVECQALTVDTSFPTPSRTCVGFKKERLNMLTAVLERHTGTFFSGQDIYINVVGGLHVGDPALDLALCMALLSSHKDLTISSDMILVGEVGLSGELRAVQQIESRLKEASKMGFKTAVVPHANLEGLPDKTNIQINGYKNINDVMNAIL